MTTDGFAQVGIFSHFICPYCWQSVDALQLVIEQALWRPMFPEIPTDVAGFKGADRIVGIILRSCGHQVASYFWHAMEEGPDGLASHAAMVVLP